MIGALHADVSPSFFGQKYEWGEPHDQKKLSAAGVDVDLNGHTHAGQLFPGNIIINFFWDIAYGYKNFDGMHNIVTSGVGLFGPNMRTFTKAEIAQVKIHLN